MSDDENGDEFDRNSAISQIMMEYSRSRDYAHDEDKVAEEDKMRAALEITEDEEALEQFLGMRGQVLVDAVQARRKTLEKEGVFDSEIVGGSTDRDVDPEY